VRVLISGAGVAGLTLAYWLAHYGMEPVVIERAEHLRDDGFVIDFFGAGYKVAERMSLLHDLEAIHCPVLELIFLDGSGRRRITIPYENMRMLLDDRHFSFLRGDLVQLLARKTDSPVRFSTSIMALEQDKERVNVTLTDGSEETFDLVVGADGVHSNVRRLVFGPEERFSRPLGYTIVAFVVEHLDVRSDVFYTLTAPGRRIGVFPLLDGRIAVFFFYRSLQPPTQATIMDELQISFGSLGWLVPDLLELADKAERLYVDALTQIIMPQWSQGRVVLLGDACHCVSPAGSQGASLAMVGAYILARELGSQHDRLTAFRSYEKQLKPGITRRQQVGQKAARFFFAPENTFFIALQGLNLRLMNWPLAAPLLRRNFAWQDEFAL